LTLREKNGRIASEEMAHKKGGGATSKNRDSIGKRLGIKIYGGQLATRGNIIVRQRGTKFFGGIGTKVGRDHTIFALQEGVVRFRKRFKKQFVDVV